MFSRTLFAAFSSLALIVAAHAEQAAAVSDADRAAVKKTIAAATAGQPHEKIAAEAKAVADAALRKKLTAFLPELERAAETHRRIEELVKMAVEVKGTSHTDAGGPDWLRAIVGEDDMAVFERLITLGFLNEHFGPHDKAQHSDHDTSGWIARLHDLDDLISLNFQNTLVDDAAVAKLGKLPKLEYLNVSLCPITDAAIPLLAKYPTLHRIGIGANKKLTGHGFDKLAGLKELEVINLHSSGIDDEGLRQIATLPAIKQLELGHGEYTDEGIKTLSKITRLRRIQVAGRNVTPAGLQPLGKLVNLEELFLYDNLATDASIPFVAGLPKLWFLSLVGPFTDASEPELSKLKRLKTLELGGHKLTPEALARIKAALPETDVKVK
ncbi:MAG TPA: hypothetical protein VGO11_19005 [Chthoniobacteraceae bacterium]|jgi:hypothetical protein|nr:hypothetical protein [Chthoniobacteraceae bacterium]